MASRNSSEVVAATTTLSPCALICWASCFSGVGLSERRLSRFHSD
jgi:hypothetical protein